MKKKTKRSSDRAINNNLPIIFATIAIVIGSIAIFLGGLFVNKNDFCRENASAFTSYDECTGLNSETKIDKVCAKNPNFTHTFRDDDGDEKVLGCQEIKDLGYPYDQYVVNADQYSFEVEDNMVYEVGSNAEINAGYNSGKYCTNGYHLYSFSQHKACADIPEITKYECTKEYCALIYAPEDDCPTYVIFESYNINSERIFRMRYNKPMSVYGNIAPFKKGVVVRVYEDSQIQNRVETSGTPIRCDKHYRNDLSKCDYF